MITCLATVDGNVNAASPAPHSDYAVGQGIVTFI